MINDLKTEGRWKIHISDNIEIIIGNETNEIIKELSDSLLQKYQKDVEESLKCSVNYITSVIK